MKKLMAIFLLSCSFLQADQKDASTYIQNQITMLDLILDRYDDSAFEYQLDFNYHIGFLTGRRLAYQDSLNFIKSEK